MTKRIIGVIVAIFMCYSLMFLQSCGGNEDTDLEDILEMSDEELDELFGEGAKDEEKEPPVVDNNKKPLDVFAGIDLYYTGVNGHGYAHINTEVEFTVDDFYFKPLSGEEKRYPELYGYDSINVIYNNKKICYIEYDVENNENKLKKDDTVVVTAEVKYPSAFDELDYQPVLRKTYIVPDLGEYITEEKDYTNELIEKINATFKERFKGKAKNGFIEKAYYIKAKPGTEVPGNATAFMAAIINTCNHYNQYEPYELYDIYIADGVVQYGYLQQYEELVGGYPKYLSFNSLEEAITALETNLADKYTYTEIN